MKTVKIKFIGFWSSFKQEDNFIVNAIKKNFNVELSENPDYIISSCFSHDVLKYQDCVTIFYTGENICPDFNIFDYAISYENLNFGDRHLYFSDYMIPEEYGKDYNLMLNKHKVTDSIFKDKTDFCSFVVSKGDGNVMKERENFFYQLNEYKKVNSGGRFLNNIGEPNGVKDKLEFQKKHKFSIAFENSSHLGYTTEKIVQSFAAQTVPIYFGDSSVTKKFNADSFINCHNFDNFDQVVNKVKEVDNNDELYLKMLKTPALINSISIEKENIKLENFLKNIFEQNKQDAFRRDRVGYGKKHFDYFIECEELRNAPKPESLLIKMIRKIKRIIKCPKRFI